MSETTGHPEIMRCPRCGSDIPRASLAAREATRPDSLRDWLRFLGTDDCTCDHGWHKSIGRLYGQDMGPGWVRTTTSPACPHHGDDREERCARCGTSSEHWKPQHRQAI